MKDMRDIVLCLHVFGNLAHYGLTLICCRFSVRPLVRPVQRRSPAVSIARPGPPSFGGHARPVGLTRATQQRCQQRKKKRAEQQGAA